MIWTLQGYISRELLKTFLLSAIGLTLVFSLCGGVMNMIQGEVLTAIQIFQVLLFVVPISVTLTLPVSALFACALVYGRMASDNEFDACKASGVNIRRLLAPAFALSVFVCGFTFTMSNYVLPTFAAKIEQLVRKDIQKIVLQALATRGYIKFQGYVLSADVNAASMDTTGGGLLTIRGARMLQLEGNELSRAGTVDLVQVRFTEDQETGEPIVQAELYNLHGIDVKRNHVYFSERQPFDPVAIPNQLKEKPEWWNLNELFEYIAHPQRIPTAEKEDTATRNMIREAMFFRYAIEQLTGDEGVLRLGDDRLSYEIRAESVLPAKVDPSLSELKPRLLNVQVVQRMPDHTRTYTAVRGDIRVSSGYGQRPDQVYLILQENVEFVDSTDPSTRVNKRKDELDSVVMPGFIAEAVAGFSREEVLGLHVANPDNVESLGLGTRLDDRRIKTARTFQEFQDRILGLIHSRLAFSISVLPLLVLAAALGIVFRGGQVMTSFVIAFIPALVVVMLNSLGRQYTKAPDTVILGVAVIWSGLVILALADALVLGRYLRR